MLMKTFFFGIDGGGTKTEAVLCDATGHVLLRRRCPPTNPNDVGIQTAVARLCELLREAHIFLTDMGEREVVLCVFAGIAGALNHREELLKGLCESYPADRIAVNSDAINLISSELHGGDGCCMICGTGSVCFVRRGDQIIRIGGWGYLLDRTGSGYAIGREALEAALRSHDGRGDATLLTGSITQKLGGTPWDKLTDIYEGGKSFIASFAPCVFQCADQGDRVAFEILFRQAVYLAESVEAAYQHIGAWEATLEVVLGGGVFQSSAELIDLVKQNVTVPANLILASAPPVFGAVWEAVRESRETVTKSEFDSFKSVFMNDYGSVIRNENQ